eukprot:scaffold56975_cov61-Attheya_sp.AAC.3
MEPELLGAGNGRQAPITIKVVVLGSMLGPSALFNTGYRHRANRDGKEPRVRRNSRLAYSRRHNKNATIAYTGVEMCRAKSRNQNNVTTKRPRWCRPP